MTSTKPSRRLAILCYIWSLLSNAKPISKQQKYLEGARADKKLPLRFGTSRGVRVQPAVDNPIPEVLQVTIARPRVTVQLKGLQVGQPEEDLLPYGLEEIVVDVDRLDTVAQVVEGVSLDLGQGVVR